MKFYSKPFVSYVHEFEGFMPGANGKCPVWIQKFDSYAIVTITEPVSTGSTSVTNRYEGIATEIFHRHLKEIYKPGQIIWRQHFVKQGDSWPERMVDVALKWNKKFKCYCEPEWRHAIRCEFKNPPLTESDPEEPAPGTFGRLRNRFLKKGGQHVLG